MIISDRCENWGMALRGGMLKRETPSLEGHYRPPRFSEALSAPSTRPGVNVPDAQRIESAVCVVDLYHHALLRAWHVYRLPEPVCVRRAAKAVGVAKGRPSGFESSLLMAYSLLGAALDLPAVVRKSRAREIVERALGEAYDDAFA